MKKIKIKILSREPHISQILTGFCMLERMYRGEYELQIEPCMDKYPDRVFVEAYYKDSKIIYDMFDGYQYPEIIASQLIDCDYYFKRSYSEQKNIELGLPNLKKMFPLGFNYHVSCNNHPLDKPWWKEEIKKCLHIDSNMYSNTSFSSKAFEEIPCYREGPFQILFLTRLWGEEPIDNMRVNIIRSLRSMKDVRFIGGITDKPYSRKYAPDLIVGNKFTDRHQYLKLMHKSDICIGSTGLFESIGWKTGEYVAAAKGIVNEKMHYTVPGDFSVGKNYLEFTTADECVSAVRSLVASPQKLYEMKKANRDYYCSYLRPDMLVKNTLNIVDASM